MHTFRVWAPDAHSVSVQLADQAHPLQHAELSWWQTTIEAARPGDLYRFVLDNGQPLPDPRSAFQPQGVNGPSQIVDHSAFAWADRHWQPQPLASAILYELHIGTFTPGGTFLSAIDRLDHLVELGITHIELMPVCEFSGNSGWGYDGVDLFAPHHSYGAPDELKQLVNACHAKGLAVLLDVVYNHLGPSGNYLPQFGPYFTSEYHTPWGSAVNFDHPGSIEVRRFFLDNAAMWLRDYHFDGLRLDAVHAYVDSSATHFLESLSRELAALSAHLGRYFVSIAESDLNNPRIVLPREAGGYGIDAQWSDDFHHALHAVLTGETNGYYEDFGSLSQLAKALQQAFVFDGIASAHRKRLHGRPIGSLSGHHFLAYAQNHDQIGNRATGERLSHLTSIGRAKIAAVLVLTSAYIPMLFQGEEFGASAPFQYFTHHEDKELGHNVSKGRRNEFAAFGWQPKDVPDPQDSATFERSKLNWDELTKSPHADLLQWHKDLIALRRKSPSLTSGDLKDVRVHFDEAAHWLTIQRGHVQIICNLAEKPQCFPVGKHAEVHLCSETTYELKDETLKLPQDSVAILVAPSAH